MKNMAPREITGGARLPTIFPKTTAIWQANVRSTLKHNVIFTIFAAILSQLEELRRKFDNNQG